MVYHLPLLAHNCRSLVSSAHPNEISGTMKSVVRQLQQNTPHTRKRSSQPLREPLSTIIERWKERRKFYKLVKRLPEGYKAEASSCKHENGNLITDQQEVLWLWKKHFFTLLQCDDDTNTALKKMFRTRSMMTAKRFRHLIIRWSKSRLCVQVLMASLQNCLKPDVMRRRLKPLVKKLGNRNFSRTAKLILYKNSFYPYFFMAQKHWPYWALVQQPSEYSREKSYVRSSIQCELAMISSFDSIVSCMSFLTT